MSMFKISLLALALAVVTVSSASAVTVKSKSGGYTDLYYPQPAYPSSREAQEQLTW